MSSIPTQQYPLEDSRMEKQILEDDRVDRISQLPDSILHHILSYLPTINCVGSSILSTRWKNLYASMPNHNLVFEDTLPKRESRLESSASSTSFVDFVYRVLTTILHDVNDHKNIISNVSYVNSFSLFCQQDHGDSHINAWIQSLALANVQELSLNIDVKNSNLLHNSLFGCKSVVKLSLGYDLLLRVPNLVYFPNLKNLSFENVKFMDGDSFQRVLNGCPVLEDLEIDTCEWVDMRILIISVHSLKRLDLRKTYSWIHYKILLDTPALEYFFSQGDCLCESKVDIMSSLLEARLDVGLNEDQWEEEGLSHYGRKVAKLVTACSNVVYLYLSSHVIEGIHDSGSAMPTFHKLTQLELGRIDIHGWKLLPQLLEISLNLEVLKFTKGFSVFKNCYPIFENHLPENVPMCLSLHLQEIRFVGFKGEFDELMLVEYFLNNSKVLRKLEINTCSEMHSWISEKILMLPRCSKSCKIVLQTKDCFTNHTIHTPTSLCL